HRVVRSRRGPYLVGPWLTGGTLSERIRGPFPLADVLALVEGIGSALDTLHAAGWCHGDVSAENVLFATDGRQPTAPRRPGVLGRQAVLADLGTARRIGERASEGGAICVTPIVTAPEVWLGEPLDGCSDLYSLGVLLYLALAGAYPFEADATQD